MTTTRRSPIDDSKGGRKRSTTKDARKQGAKGTRQSGAGVERVRSDRVRERGSSTVHPVHDRPRKDRSRQSASDNRSGGEGDLRRVRGHRRQASQEARTARGGGKYNVNDWKVSSAFVDRNGTPLYQGAEVRFHAFSGNVMRAVVESDGILGRMISVLIRGDPFPTYTDHRQLQLLPQGEEEMPRTATAEAPTAKELRRTAKTLGVRNWEEMTRDELQEAIDEAQENGDEAPPRRTAKASTRATKATRSSKAASKPATATKATRTAKSTKSSSKAKTTGKRAAPKPPANEDDGPNPFRPNTNLWHVCEALQKGGKRSELVRKLLPKMEYNPRVQKESDFDPEAETDRRLKVIGYILKKQHGWEYEHEGRGPDAYIKCTPPS